MENQQKTNRPNQPDCVPIGEREAAKKVINTLMVAITNTCLYPEEHAICQQSISHAFTQINTFISNYGDLKITIKDSRFLYEGQEIYQGPADSSNVAFMFFRDGILWLEFQPQLKIEEIKELFQIINQYKNPQEEAEGDLATALWEADFTHIMYAAADINPDPDIFLDFPLFQVVGKTEDGGCHLEIAAETDRSASGHGNYQQEQPPQFQPIPRDNRKNSGESTQNPPTGSRIAHLVGEKNYGSGNGPQVSSNLGTDQVLETGKRRQSKGLEIAVPLRQVDRHLWALTEEEEASLQQMVTEEEQRARSENVFDVLLSVLKTQTNENDFAEILVFLQSEFKESLFQQQFSSSLHLLQVLRSIYAQDNPGKKWVRPLIAKFFTTISSPPTLQILVQIWPDIVGQTMHRQQALAQVCQHLTPIANQTLIPLLAGSKTSHLHHQLAKIVNHFANRDPVPLQALMDHQDESVLLKLIDIISAINNQQTSTMLLTLAKHSNPQVRKEAIKTLLNREKNILPKLIHCLDDEHDTNRLMMLHYLGRERHNLAEHLLLEYFSKHPFHADECNHLLACYKALGRCGSDRSLPFLKKMLLEHGWNVFSNLVKCHREGAALALALLKTEKAAALLQQAAKSRHPLVRHACRKTMERK